MKVLGPKVPGTPALSVIVNARVIWASADFKSTLLVNAVGILVIALPVADLKFKCNITKSFFPSAFAKGPFGKFSPPGIAFPRVELKAFISMALVCPLKSTNISILSPACNK